MEISSLVAVFYVGVGPGNAKSCYAGIQRLNGVSVLGVTSEFNPRSE
jgi:hypothetical protein